MQKCEIMLNDLIDSKRTNTNIKATMNKSSQTGALLLVIHESLGSEAKEYFEKSISQGMGLRLP